MNLQYGALLLSPDDVVMAASDGLGDVLDPIAAKVPPKQFGLRFAVCVLSADVLRGDVFSGGFCLPCTWE